MDYNKIYGEEYYKTLGDLPYDRPEWAHIFEGIADRIVNDIHPKTVLDVGCAMGHLVAALRDRGIEAYGIDVSEYAISKVREDIKPYCRIASALEQLPMDLPSKYDLVVTIEVVEHLYEEDGIVFIDNICKYSDDIIFSSSPEDIYDITHLNVQQPEYWAKKFATNKFYKELEYDAGYIAPQANRFIKQDLQPVRLVENYERNFRGIKYKLEKKIQEEQALIKEKKELIHQNENLAKINEGLKDKNEEISRINQELKAENEETIRINEKLKAEEEEKNTRINKELKDKIKDEEINNKNLSQQLIEKDIKINELNIALESIHLSRGYKMLCKCYRIRDYILPKQSKRFIIAKMMFRLPTYIKKGYIFKVLKYLRPSKIHQLKNKIRQVIYGVSDATMVKAIEDTYKLWIQNNEPSREELFQQKQFKFEYMPKISIVVPIYNTPGKFLTDMIQSVFDQTYSNWELCLADGGSKNIIEIKKIISKFADNRIILKEISENRGIAGNTNEAIQISTGEFIAFLDHDDMIPSFALYEIVKSINENDNVEFIYSDDDRFVNSLDDRSSPCFKPDFSPDQLRCCNYIGHFSIIKKSLLDEIGWLESKYNGSQDYDLVLRATEKAAKIVHIPKILYNWRMHSGSVSLNGEAKTYAYDAAKEAIRAHLDRIGLEGEVVDGKILGSYKINYKIKGMPLVSIVIPTMDHIEELKVCVDSIINKSTYSNYEIVLVENNSKKEETFEYYNQLGDDNRVRVIKWNGTGFNYSSIVNHGVENAKGEYIIILNNDTEIITHEWIQELLMFAQRKDVGSVGGKLYYPDYTIWNTGIALDKKRSVTLLHNKIDGASYGYYGRTMTVQNFSALAGACVMVKKETYCNAGGLDEVNFKVAHNDMDFSLRLIQLGKLNVFTPYCELYHHESKSRGSDFEGDNLMRFMEEDNKFITKWQDYLENGDPYYNINLSVETPLLQVKTEKIK